MYIFEKHNYSRDDGDQWRREEEKEERKGKWKKKK